MGTDAAAERLCGKSALFGLLVGGIPECGRKDAGRPA